MTCHSQIDRNYPLRVTLTSFELVTPSFKVGLRDRRLSYIDTQDFSARVGIASTVSCDQKLQSSGSLRCLSDHSRNHVLRDFEVLKVKNIWIFPENDLNGTD